MPTASTIASKRAARLEELRLDKGYSMRAVSELLKKEGIKLSPASLSNYEADDSVQIKRPVLRKLAELYGSSVEFIETGRHPRPTDEVGNAHFVHPALMEEYLILPAVPVRVRASFVEMVGSGSEYGDLDTMRVYYPAQELRKEGSINIEVDGDSMEPQLRSGMWVAAYPLDPGDFKYATSGVYVVDYGSSLVIKRIKDNDLLRSGTLTLHSDNPRAGSVIIESQDLRRLWRVVQVVMARVE